MINFEGLLVKSRKFQIVVRQGEAKLVQVILVFYPHKDKTQDIQ